MIAQTTTAHAPTSTPTGSLTVAAFRHPQGCRTYLVADPDSGEALAIDVHLDFVHAVSERIKAEGWKLRFVVDTHTHADHPSGSGALVAAHNNATRVAHADAHHAGVSLHPTDGEQLALGDQHITIKHAPGHTPDHVVLLTEHVLFAGDSLFIGGVARTDFLGGDAGTLYDSLQRVLDGLDDGVIVFPGHDYEGRERTTVGAERADNPWLAMERDEFIRNLTANPPARPANMDDLLRLNRAAVEIPATISAAEAVQHVTAGGATTVIDVRTGVEYDSDHISGSRLITLDQLEQRIDEVRATPAPRLLLCRTGSRAEMARKTLAGLNVAGLTVIEGGIEAYARAGGETEKGANVMSIERQVRIGAGSLMLLSLGLGVAVHPLFLALGAFVGAGQVFAGVTDWCGMGLALAKAPWNQRTAAASAASGSCAASAPAACAASVPAACAASVPPKTEG